MLYGGPLGTYLSGLSSSSPSTSNTNYSTNASSGGSNYYYYNLNNASALNNSSGSSGAANIGSSIGSTGIGSSNSSMMNANTSSSNNNTNSYSALRRTNSRYRNPNNVVSNLTSTISTNPYSSYFTPPVRRKYCSNEAELPKSSRYLSRTSTTNNASSGSSANTSSSATIAPTNAGLPQYPRKAVSSYTSGIVNTKLSSGSNYGSQLGTSNSWNSDLNSAAYKVIDYKKLYEEEKLMSEELCKEIKLARKEMKELEERIQIVNISTRRESNSKLNKENTDSEADLKVLEELRTESEKLHAQHRALIRVVSRLHREQ